jgi:hypothetical protein
MLFNKYVTLPLLQLMLRSFLIKTWYHLLKESPCPLQVVEQNLKTRVWFGGSPSPYNSDLPALDHIQGRCNSKRVCHAANRVSNNKADL